MSPAVALLVTTVARCSQHRPLLRSIRSVLGDWDGTLHQQGASVGEVSFRVHRVAYAGLGCAGRWTFLGLDLTGKVFRFREVITNGANEVCKGIGIVWLKPIDGQTLAYRWTDGHLISAATVELRAAVSKP